MDANEKIAVNNNEEIKKNFGSVERNLSNYSSSDSDIFNEKNNKLLASIKINKASVNAMKGNNARIIK